MHNQPILITGCQRSGTTLLCLILDSHPQVRAVDETEFKPLEPARSEIDSHVRIAFKLPTIAHEVASFREVAGLKVIWCLRDPRDVIASMLRLQLPLGEGTASWATHPWGVDHEIMNCATTLGSALVPERFKRVQRFHAIRRKPPGARTRPDAVIAASLCWRLKQELVPLYNWLHVPYHVIRYERLVTDPKATVGGLLRFLGLPWHDDVLRHDQLHAGKAIGSTDGGKPIDATNTGKWKQSLEPADLEIVRAVCSDVARTFDYDLTD